MNWIALFNVLVNISATGAALVLLNRISNRRIRCLVLIMGMVAFSQTFSFILIFENEIWSHMIWGCQRMVATCGSAAGLYYLFREMTDRNRTDRILRLTEHENQVMQSRLEKRTQPRTAEVAPSPQ